MPNFDLHLHTEFSPDCDTALAGIEAHCLAVGLTGIAVTDHDTIEGALRLRDRVKTLKIIISEEITTRDGDVVGLFLRERIPPKLSAVETIAAIHAQGGLAYLPHPFDKQRARQTGGASLAEIVGAVDIVETYNGKVGKASYNTLAADYALKNHKIAGGGSDAHTLAAIGTVYNEIELPEDYDYSDAQVFLQAMQTARIVGTRRSPIGGSELRPNQILRILRLLGPLWWNPNVRSLRLILDGAEQREAAVMVAIANTPYLGEGIPIAPEARLNDGVFDVVLIGEMTRWELAVFARSALRGTHLSLPKTRRTQARTVEIRRAHPRLRPLPVHADDRIAAHTPARFEVVPAALRVLA